MTKIRMASGARMDAQYVRHLQTLTGGAQGDTTVDLYRTAFGRLVVCTRPADDDRVDPKVDLDSTPADYGVRED